MSKKRQESGAMKRVRYDGPAVSVGAYKPGIVYEVELAESDRLVSVKGFVEVADEKE